MSRLRFAFSALKLTDHGHSVVLRPSGRSECEPESHHNAWITLGCQTDKDGKYAITPPFFLIHENQTVLVQPRLLFATQRHALVRQTRLLQWAYIHGERRLGLHTLQRVFIYCIHFPYRSNCAHPWRRRGLLVISTAGNFRSSVSLSEWQINDRILPSACLWICISLDVFYVTPTAGRSSKCISLTTHNRKPPNSQWVVFKIISDVSYVAVLKQWNLLAGIFFSWSETGWLLQIQTWKMLGKSWALRGVREKQVGEQKLGPVLIPVAILDGGSSGDAGGLVEVEEKTPSSWPQCLW